MAHSVSNRRTGRIHHRRFYHWRTCRFEPLEIRQVLSIDTAALSALAVPMIKPLPGQSASPIGYTPAQIRQAYGFDNITFLGPHGTKIVGDGTGQTIAIIDAQSNPTIRDDLHTFDQQFGIADPPKFTIVNERGSTNSATLPTADVGWAQEITLDVEWSHAIAPGANILLIEANDLIAAADFARNYPGVSVVSNSYSFGFQEFIGENTLDYHYTTPSGHQGVTFVFSADDVGATAVWPSASPNVVTVGGTKLTLNKSTNAITSEVVWNEGTIGGATGGGASLVESLPNYQSTVAKKIGLTTRGTPDVSYNADPFTGFAVYSSFAFGGWEEIGGTSAGAPQWAALMAIVDQGRVLQGKGSIANAQASLYKLPSTDFHDITSGSNPGLIFNVPGATATMGYDLASGLGSPYADRVVAGLVAITGSTYIPPISRGVLGTTNGTWYFAKAAGLTAGGDSSAVNAATDFAPIPHIETEFTIADQLIADAPNTASLWQNTDLAHENAAPFQLAADFRDDNSLLTHQSCDHYNNDLNSADSSLDYFFAQI